MANPEITGVHLVGSVPLPTAEDTFQMVCKKLPERLKRVPDGEPGERNNFIMWQGLLLKDNAPLVLSEFMNPNAPKTLTDEQVDDAVKTISSLETGYDTAALASYEKFKKLRDDGVIPPGVRFLVGLPPPLEIVAPFVRQSLKSRVEPLWEDAMLRSLDRLQNGIPASDLAVQWDCANEFAMIEGNAAYGMTGPPWFEPVTEGIIDRLVALSEHTPEEVELGYHFCYGIAYLGRDAPFVKHHH